MQGEISFPLPKKVDWNKIRTRYCVLKALIGGAKSPEEIRLSILHLKEHSKISRGDLQNDSSSVNDVILELNRELKISKRHILNTSTKESRIEYFLNPLWLSGTRILKKDLSRARLRERMQKRNADRKHNLEKLHKEAVQEQKVQTDSVAVLHERPITSKTDCIKSTTDTTPMPQKHEEGAEGFTVFKVVLGIVGFGGAILIVGRITEAISEALTFPVLIAGCLVVGIFYHLKNQS
jgi:hypothetical protein